MFPTKGSELFLENRSDPFILSLSKPGKSSILFGPRYGNEGGREANDFLVRCPVSSNTLFSVPTRLYVGTFTKADRFPSTCIIDERSNGIVIQYMKALRIK